MDARGITARWVRAVAFGAAVAGGSCSRPEPVLHDLAALVPAAELVAPGRQVVRFGLVTAERHQRDGLFAATAEPDLDPHAVVRRRAEIALTLTDVRPRSLVFDLAPMPELGRQAVEVALNDTPLGRVELRSERARYAVAVPVVAQKHGENLLRLVFDEVLDRRGARQRVAARLFSLAVVDPADRFASASGVPELVATGRTEGVPEVRQLGPSEIGFILRLRGGGTLRFSPRVAGSGPALLRVTAREDGGPARELWRTSLSAGEDEAEVAIELPEAPLLRVALHVEPSDARALPVATWRAPRITGPGEPDPIVAASDVPPAPNVSDAIARGQNVVLVILDAAGARHFSAYGYHRRTTPNVEQLAAEGVTFEQAYAPAGYTMLSMGTLWSSQHPDEHHNGIPMNAKLPPGLLTVAELLSANGYATAGFVRNAQAGTARGLERGFTEFEETFEGLGRGARAIRALLPDWLARHGDRRFFLYVHFREPHFPYNPPEPFDALFGPPGPLPPRAASSAGWLRRVNADPSQLSEAERRELERRYDANLAYVDGEVGELRRLLESRGLLDRTSLIVTADHGEAIGEHGFIGHEAEVYGAVTHIPLVLRLPGGPRGVRRPGLVELSDVGATIADLAGLLGKGGSDRTFRGRSLLPALTSPWSRSFVVSRTPPEQPAYALRDEAFVYHLHTRTGREELYDAVADPGERNDLSARQPMRTALYRQALVGFVLQKRRGGASEEAPETPLTPEQEENLRALGYVN